MSGEPAGKWTPPPLESAAESVKPTILVPGSHKDDTGAVIEIGTHDFADAVLAALPPGTLYRMEREVGWIEGGAGSSLFRAADESALRMVVDTHVRLASWGTVGRGKSAKPALKFTECTKDRATLVLSRAAGHAATRALKLLVNYPVYLPGWERAKPGWNDCGVYYDEPPALCEIKPDPIGALDVLDDLFVDFPLREEADRQNLYAAMLTILCRPAIEGTTPFFLAMAPMERTGKGKLIDTASHAIRGTSVPPTQIGREEAEVDKRITSHILSGAPVIHLDNLPTGDTVDSPSLASLATAYPLWSGRRLGANETILLPNRIVVFMSGNNPKATGELVKRTVPIVLSPRSDHPELRDDFQHPDCFGYADERRVAVLSALTGMVECWKEWGQPSPCTRMGGFERWVRSVGGILGLAGADRFLANYSDWCRAADDQNADLETLVECWATRHPGVDVTSSQIMTLVEELGIFDEVRAGKNDQAKAMRLSHKVLIPMVDRPVGAWTARRGGKGSNATYRLEKSFLGT